MVGTLKIDEKDYGGSAKILPGEFLRLLGLDTPEWREKIAKEGIICVLGDQLTMERLMGLFKHRGEDFNSLDRLDVFIFVFGWFHAKMTFAISVWNQYMGTNPGHGLSHVFNILSCSIFSVEKVSKLRARKAHSIIIFMKLYSILLKLTFSAAGFK